MEHIDVLNASGEQQRPIVVALGMAVHRLVDRDTVNPERDVRRVIGAEPTQRRIGREPWTASQSESPTV